MNCLIPFILLPILTRYLSSEEYGELAMFTVWISFITVFCGLNVNSSANRKYYELKENMNSLAIYIGNCILILLVCSSFIFLISNFLVELLSNTLGIREPLIMVGVIIAFCNVLIQIRLGQWQVSQHPIQFGVFLISLSLSNLLISLYLVVNLNMQVDGRVLGILSSAVIFLFVAIILLKIDKLLVFRANIKYIKEAVRFGAPLIPHVVGAFLLLSIDRAFISYKLGLDSAGVYMVAVQFSLAVSVILDSINKAFSPWLFNILNEENDYEKKKVVSVTYLLYGLILLGVLISFLVSEYLVRLIVGSEFIVAAEIVPFLVFGQGVRGMYLLVTNYMFYAKKTKIISYVTISSGLLNVILLSFLIDIFGIIGAPYSFIASMVVQWLATWYFANKYVRMPWSNIFFKSIPKM